MSAEKAKDKLHAKEMAVFHKKSRGWCFTINNYTPDDMGYCSALQCYPAFIYCILGFEVGKDGTPHIQGFVYLKNDHRIQTLKDMLPRAHLEPAGAKKEGLMLKTNYQYCQKDGNFVEFGEFPQNGRASKRAVESAMRNPDNDLALYTQYRKSYRESRLQYHVQKKREIRVCCDDSFVDDEDPLKYCLSKDINDYDGESMMFIQARSHYLGDDLDIVINWKRGARAHVKHGYERIKFDPDLVVIIFDTDEQVKKFRYRYSKYLSKEDNISLEDIQCLEPCVNDEDASASQEQS